MSGAIHCRANVSGLRLKAVIGSAPAPFVRGRKLTAFSKKEEHDYARDDVIDFLAESTVGDRALADRQALVVHHRALSHFIDAPKPVAFRACAFWRVG